MLSFLHQLGKRSYSTQSSTSYLKSSESGLGAMNEASEAYFNLASFTIPSNTTDAATISVDTAPQPQSYTRTSERLRRVHSSPGCYNENVLSGSARKPRREVEVRDTRTVSGETLIDSDEEAQKKSVKNSVELLSPISGKEDDKLCRRRSTRLEMFDRTTKFLEKARGVLGKRSRETTNAGTERKQVSTENKMAGLKSRENEALDQGGALVFEGPLKKRARLLEETNPQALLSPTESEHRFATQPETKHWLSQGLYVGQDRDVGVRSRETKNRPKKPASDDHVSQPRTFLPMPMFAGQRMLDLGRSFKLPFDVFSPLPPGQPRPEEWKKTHKNVFVGDAAKVWKKSKPLESSRCICSLETGCDEECFNRFMFYECDNGNCNIGAEHCTNRSFEELRQRVKSGGKYNIGVEVIKTYDRGHGVRSNRSFEPNQIIVEYTGEIITQEECDNRMNKRYKDSECYYLMDFDQQMILDATRGSIARFVNHSCEPNCKMVKWTVAGTPRMALFAGEKGIMTGDELTYDYNFNPYSVKNVQECRCGAASCRGVLGPRPKEIKDALRPLTTGGKRKYQQALEDSFSTLTKKRKTNIPSPIKHAVAAVKSCARQTLTQGRVLGSSSARNERLMKKVSARSLRGVSRTTTLQSTENAIKRNITSTYASRRPSRGTSATAENDAPPRSRKDSFAFKATTLRKNVVHTVRRSSRRVSSNVAKTIRVIGDENQ